VFDVNPQFHTWKRQLSTRQSCQAEFEKWLFLHTAPVLLGKKAGELLTLMSDQFGLCVAQQLIYLKNAADSWHVAYRVIRETEASVQFMIYHADMVQQQLDSVPPCMLHDELGYSINITAAGFLAEVQRRWLLNGDIPHEIGFALGYPVKDVLGFMGLQPLPCSGCCGWKVYGELAPSRALGEAFTQAKQAASRFLHCPLVESHQPGTAGHNAPPTCSGSRCIRSD
jgi:hypothetical protein